MGHAGCWCRALAPIFLTGSLFQHACTTQRCSPARTWASSRFQPPATPTTLTPTLPTRRVPCVYLRVCHTLFTQSRHTVFKCRSNASASIHLRHAVLLVCLPLGFMSEHMQWGAVATFSLVSDTCPQLHVVLGHTPLLHPARPAASGVLRAQRFRVSVLNVFKTLTLKSAFPQNFLALIPLALILGDITEDLALRFGDVIGGLINATFGNVVCAGDGWMCVCVCACARARVCVCVRARARVRARMGRGGS